MTISSSDAIVPAIQAAAGFIQGRVPLPDGRSLVLHCSSPADNVWRIQIARSQQACSEPSAVERLASLHGRSVKLARTAPHAAPFDDGAWTIGPGGAAASIHLRLAPFELRFTGADGSERLVISGVDATADELTVSGPLVDDEVLYGTGQRFNGTNQRGKHVVIWAEDRWCHTEGNSYVPIPFLLSTQKYGLMLNRFELSRFDLGAVAADRWSVATTADVLDLLVFVDDDPRQVLAQLGRLTGFAPKPPDWSYGVFVSRHDRLQEFATVQGVRDMVAAMDRHDLPWSAAIIEGWRTYDTRRYDELKTLVDELHARGKKVLVYDTCGRLDASAWPAFDGRADYFVRTTDGATAIDEADFYNPADAPVKKKVSFVDLTNPQAVAWWTTRVWGKLIGEIGVDGIKIDFCEQFPESDDLVLHDGGAAGMHQLYPVIYNSLMYNLLQQHRPDGGLCWSRGGGIGASAYPFIWCGDQPREFRYLPAILAASLSTGLSGLPFQGHDLGGYIPARLVDGNPEAEVFVRGTQLACFSPNMQTHGTVTRPYDFDPATIALYRAYSRVHYALVPYLQEQAAIACRTNVPLMRHLYLHHPDDPAVRSIEDQYFLGDDLLVAPVLTRSEQRDIYLPAGQWEDLHTGTVHDGPRWLRAHPAPLACVPVFLAHPASSAALPSALDAIRTHLRAAAAAG